MAFKPGVTSKPAPVSIQASDPESNSIIDIESVLSVLCFDSNGKKNLNSCKRKTQGKVKNALFGIFLVLVERSLGTPQ